MAQVALAAKDCRICGNIGTADLCPICADPARATGEICVVEDVADLWALERAGVFRGRYHVLGGTLSALDAIGPEDLGIPRLVGRVAGRGRARGDPGAERHRRRPDHRALHRRCAGADRRCRSRTLAQGVPVGGELDYLDDGTLGAALRARHRV